MTRLTEILRLNEQEGIRAFLDALSAQFDDQVSDVWLFGSKARGESSVYSDIDLLIVVRHLTPQTRWRIREVAADFSLEYDVLFNTHILPVQVWQRHIEQGSTFWKEIQQDGILLTATLANDTQPVYQGMADLL